MTVKKTEGAKKTVKKTKEDLLTTYDDSLQLVKERGELVLNPEKIVEEKKAAAAVQIAEALSSGDVPREINDLKSTISRMLAELSEKLEQQVARFNDVQQAIAAKEKELKEVYEIGRTAGTLAALIEAQNLKRVEFEQQMEEAKQTLEAEITTARAAWEKERKEHELQTKAMQEALGQSREREKTEFDYAFKREQQLARDKFNDELAQKEKELKAKSEAFQKDWTARSNALKEAEAELNELRARAGQFSAQLEAAVQKAVQETAQRLKAESTATLNLITKEFEGERNVLKARIEAHQTTVQQQAEQIVKLAQQQELAYEKMQNIAVRAIEGAGNAKSMASLQELLAEQLKKQTREEK